MHDALGWAGWDSRLYQGSISKAPLTTRTLKPPHSSEGLGLLLPDIEDEETERPCEWLKVTQLERGQARTAGFPDSKAPRLFSTQLGPGEGSYDPESSLF